VNAWCLALAALLYLGVAVDFTLKGEGWLALAWLAYALANVGFIGAYK